MTELTVINQTDVLGKDFKVYGDFESPLFLAKDVAEWIEHSNSRIMLQGVDEDEKVVNIAYTLGGNQETWFLTENGLYEVLMQSRKPIAKAFKKEVKKILRSLRMRKQQAPMSVQDILIATLQEQKKIADRVDEVEDKLNNQMTIDHAQQRIIQKKVGFKVYERLVENRLPATKENTRAYFQSLYKALKNTFGVGSYLDIKVGDFDDAVAFINVWREPIELKSVAIK